MILRMSYEEATVLNSVTERLLSAWGGGGVAAPPEVLAELETHAPLRGDISVMTLAQQRRLMAAVNYVVEHLKGRMDTLVVELYVGAEDAVNAYFDYANALTLRSRVAAMGREMVAMIELMTGEAPTEEMAELVTFAD
jgi:hypothetical protein